MSGGSILMDMAIAFHWSSLGCWVVLTALRLLLSCHLHHWKARPSVTNWKSLCPFVTSHSFPTWCIVIVIRLKGARWQATTSRVHLPKIFILGQHILLYNLNTATGPFRCVTYGFCGPMLLSFIFVDSDLHKATTAWACVKANHDSKDVLLIMWCVSCAHAKLQDQMFLYQTSWE